MTIKIEDFIDHGNNKLRHVRIKLVKSKSIEFLDGCEGCIFNNEEEHMDCSLIGSSMTCVVDMHYNYVWKNVLEEDEKEKNT